MGFNNKKERELLFAIKQCYDYEFKLLENGIRTRFLKTFHMLSITRASQSFETMRKGQKLLKLTRFKHHVFSKTALENY
ncbi:CLUMA_CG018806, isoform A [Clunio marinus]|uniref:CLUMA_CG018806, isoform A n=1 Tax=Clunio marinus TaxID=568069 RepID=A0A1J1J1G4_9DIPT|nr:CLUMA_CG018806, isoform A [Clunio marinus]